MSWFADSMVNRDPRPDEIGLIVRPIFSGTDPGVLTVQLSSGSNLSIGNISGSFSQPQPGVGTLVSIGSDVVPVVVASGNTGRLGLTVFNDSSGPVCLRLGLGVTSTMFTVRLSAQDFYELPFPTYTGVVTGVWPVSGTGNILVTELT